MAYKNKKDKYKNQTKRRIERKLKAIEYKGGVCFCCGETYPYPAMQFHHRNPDEKESIWNTLRFQSWDKVIEELDKCDLLCANCHSIHHSNYSPEETVEEEI
jgi:hypothetical protein